jgi:hypothetical protein
VLKVERVLNWQEKELLQPHVDEYRRALEKAEQRRLRMLAAAAAVEPRMMSEHWQFDPDTFSFASPDGGIIPIAERNSSGQP